MPSGLFLRGTILLAALNSSNLLRVPCVNQYPFHSNQPALAGWIVAPPQPTS